MLCLFIDIYYCNYGMQLKYNSLICECDMNSLPINVTLANEGKRDVFANFGRLEGWLCTHCNIYCQAVISKITIVGNYSTN